MLTRYAQEGKLILELPPKDIKLVTLRFSAEERDVSVALSLCSKYS